MFKFTNPCRRARCILWLSAAFVLLASSRIASASLVLVPVQSFSGTVASVPIPPAFGDNLETGPITLSLNPLAVNVFGLDDVLQQGFIDVTVLLTSPLFTALGETPVIRIVESGPASVEFVISEDFDFLFHAELTGGGTVETGLFAGTEFQNVNVYEGRGLLGSWIPLPFSPITWDIQNNGSVTFPDNTVVEGVSGSGLTMVTPEPSSLTLSGLGMAAIIALLRRGRRAKP